MISLIPEGLRKGGCQLQPDALINAAAYTALDQAESEPDLAMKVTLTARAY